MNKKISTTPYSLKILSTDVIRLASVAPDLNIKKLIAFITDKIQTTFGQAELGYHCQITRNCHYKCQKCFLNTYFDKKSSYQACTSLDSNSRYKLVSIIEDIIYRNI